jgi:RNase P/RNase MRP subunit p29
MIEKASVALEIKQDDGNNIIRLGQNLIGRPYDRIKKMSRRQK